MRYLLLVLAAAAAADARALSFDVRYESDRERETGLAATGYSAGISQGLGRYFFVGASYAQLRTEPFSDGDLTGRLEYASAGVAFGAGHPLSDRFGLGASVGYAGSETRGLDDFANDAVHRVHGPVGSLMLDARPNDWLSWYFGPSYSYVGRVPGWHGTAGVSLRLLRSLWLNTSYWGAESAQGWNAGLRKDFGAD